MPRIDAIGFDWGGVILQHGGKNFNDVAAHFLKVEGDEFRRAFFLHNHMCNKGPKTKSWNEATEMWRAILNELDMGEKLLPFMELVRNQPPGKICQDMIELIRRLKQEGWRIGLLSNTSSDGAQEIRRQECFRLFDIALFSAEIGYMKPEPEAFLKFAEDLQVDINHLLFIDDSQRSLSTASAVGYTPLRFRSHEQLVDELETMGIIKHAMDSR